MLTAIPRALFIAAAACMLLLPFAVHADTIRVVDPFVREVPPGAPATAAFMTLQNSGDTPVRLISAANDHTAHSELHNHVDVEGVMQMRQIEYIEVPAEGSVHLAPGGLHLMLIGLENAVHEGDNVTLTLHFDNGDTVELIAPVRPVMPMHH